MKTMVAALLVMAACGKQDPGDGGSASSAPKPAPAPSGAPAFKLASVTAKTGAPCTGKTMAWLGGKLVEIDEADVTGDPEKSFRGFDSEGRLAPASGSWRPAPALSKDDPPPPADACTAVLVDRDVPAAQVQAALASLGDRCIAFIGKRDRTLGTLMPQPCPPKPASAEDVEIQVVVDKGKMVVTLTKVDDRAEVADKAKLAETLQRHKASTYFSERSDLTISFPADAKMGDVIEMLDAVYATGFTGARWVLAK